MHYWKDKEYNTFYTFLEAVDLKNLGLDKAKVHNRLGDPDTQ